MEASGTRAVWVTNLPAPYRFPVWDALSRSVDLRVILLATERPGHRWSVPAGTAYVVRRGAPAAQVARFVRGCDTVLVVGGWERPTYVLAMLIGRLRHVPVVVFYESTLRSHRFRAGPVARFRSGFFRAADAVLAVGTASRDAVLDLGVAPERIVTGFNTVDVAEYQAQTARLRQALPGADGHRILYVGQLIPRKNVSSAIRAWARIRRAGDSFAIVGSGPEELPLRRLTAELGVGASVTFAGRLQGEALFAQLAAAQTLVLPSLVEVWGLVVNEALAAGLHVVVSREAGIADSVAAMPGVFVTAPDVTSLAAALQASRQAWAGPITGHPILRESPARLARAARAAIELAAGARRCS